MGQSYLGLIWTCCSQNWPPRPLYISPPSPSYVHPPAKGRSPVTDEEENRLVSPVQANCRFSSIFKRILCLAYHRNHAPNSSRCWLLIYSEDVVTHTNDDVTVILLEVG